MIQRFVFLFGIFLLANAINGGETVNPILTFGSCVEKIDGMKCIPAGEFIRGSDTGEPDERPQEKVYVSEFYMDTYEVTNAAFQKCLDSGKCRGCFRKKQCHRIGPSYGWRYKKPQQPIVGVSWYTAREYCKFMGKRLPTEAEWEKAARGPNGNMYPWGNEPATCKLAVISEKGRKGCVPKILPTDWHMPTDSVGTRSPGVYGLYDMAGNSWEWVNDWYTSSYAKCGDACRGKDPKGPCQGKDKCRGYFRRVLKSGSWWWKGYYARGAKRRAHIPQNFPEYHHFGFRCAKDSKPVNILPQERKGKIIQSK
ncbi:MAG: SUMF1/EgtB/PvdO family nonheme iron enzyme [Spirochaetota bacterium]